MKDNMHIIHVMFSDMYKLGYVIRYYCIQPVYTVTVHLGNTIVTKMYKVRKFD